MNFHIWLLLKKGYAAKKHIRTIDRHLLNSHNKAIRHIIILILELKELRLKGLNNMLKITWPVEGRGRIWTLLFLLGPRGLTLTCHTLYSQCTLTARTGTVTCLPKFASSFWENLNGLRPSTNPTKVWQVVRLPVLDGMQQETSRSSRGAPLRWQRGASCIRFVFLLKHSERALREVATSSGSAGPETETGEAGIN